VLALSALATLGFFAAPRQRTALGTWEKIGRKRTRRD
jgi:hypothetical protein